MKKRKDLNNNQLITGVMIARSYDLKLTPELIYLAEALKVEGYWNLKNWNASIQNKNLPFLRYIESILKNIGIPIHKRVLFKIKPNFDFDKEEVRLIQDNKELSFHLEKSPFDGSKKVVTSLSYKKEYKLKLKIRNKSYKIKISFSKEEIETESKFQSWAYYTISFPNKKILSFMSEYAGNHKDVNVNPFLFKSDKEYVAAAFSALVDAEGSVNYYKLIRRIRIRMRNYNYLKNWKRLLNKFNIDCRFKCYDGIESILVIEGWEDLNRLKELGIKFHHSKKSKTFDEIFKSYKRHQISRDTAYNFYVKKLKEIGRPITAKEFAEILGKSKRVVNHYFTKLLRKNLIKADKTNNAWVYFNK